MQHLLFFILLLFPLTMAAQAHDLYQKHSRYREVSLTDRRFTHKDIQPLLNILPKNFLVEEVGRSTQNRSIKMVTVGSGTEKVMFWSQMHGDEATATMALFDMFNFLRASGDGFDDFRKKILNKCTLLFVPMLNPDGAEAWTRRTALGIDMNRDALRLQTPEGRILKALQDKYKPSFSFNLHDQAPRYGVANTDKQAAVSLLATAYNEAREINAVRKRSMQIVVGMNTVLQKLAPNRVARYSDEFEPRAFGDNIQKWGSALILVESGGYPNDPDKQEIRKLNFVTLLTSLYAIADGSYEKEDIAQYEKIPENGRALYDLILRNVKTVVGGNTLLVDIGINRQEQAVFDRPEKWYIRGTIEDIGDLSVFHGIEILDASGLTLVAEKDIKLGAKADFVLMNDKKEVMFQIENGRISKK